MELPESYVNRMRDMLGEEELSLYLKSLESDARSGIRINTLKLSKEDFKELSDFELSPVPWIDGAFYYGEGDMPSKHPYYYAGMYYIQEPSAMTPAFLFDVKPGDRVLDLCAAPGGKSTALGAKLKGQGVLVSNDISNSRAKALLKNIEMFGIGNVLVASEPSDKLADRFTGFFDKILVDAPCSGEGMFRKQHSIVKNWEQYGTEYYAKLQREILPQAIKMLRPGGELLYSTCTFSPLEDEESVAFILDNFPEMKIVDLFSAEEKTRHEAMGFDHGRKEWMESPIDDIEKTVRLFPHKLEGEGHFIALLKKDENVDSYTVSASPVRSTKLPDELVEFLDYSNFSGDRKCIVERDFKYYYVSDLLPDVTGLRILRNGLLLGEQKKGRFEPSEAYAMTLDAATYPNVLNLKADDIRVKKYLKCETIELEEGLSDGWILVCVEGQPLGFGKLKKGNFKNKYLPGWRLM